jgi:hypothetical protein
MLRKKKIGNIINIIPSCTFLRRRTCTCTHTHTNTRRLTTQKNTRSVHLRGRTMLFFLSTRGPAQRPVHAVDDVVSGTTVRRRRCWTVGTGDRCPLRRENVYRTSENKLYHFHRVITRQEQHGFTVRLRHDVYRLLAHVMIVMEKTKKKKKNYDSEKT